MTASRETVQANISNSPLIDLRDVIKVYSTAAGDFTALKGINAQVQKGEFLGIIGKSGAGKSTLLNMITGVDDITTGEVVVRTNGSEKSVHQLNEDELAGPPQAAGCAGNQGYFLLGTVHFRHSCLRRSVLIPRSSSDRPYRRSWRDIPSHLACGRYSVHSQGRSPGREYYSLSSVG